MVLDSLYRLLGGVEAPLNVPCVSYTELQEQEAGGEEDAAPQGPVTDATKPSPPTEKQNQAREEPDYVVEDLTDEMLAEAVDSALERADLNQDGYVTYAEFRKLSATYKESQTV